MHMYTIYKFTYITLYVYRERGWMPGKGQKEKREQGNDLIKF